MRYLLILFILLWSLCANAQGRSPFGATRAQDTSFTRGQVRFEAYTGADTTLPVLMPNGTVKQISISRLSSGSATVDSSIFATVTRLADTAAAIRADFPSGGSADSSVFVTVTRLNDSLGLFVRYADSNSIYVTPFMLYDTARVLRLLIDARVKYTDTAGMLSPYLRSSDAAAIYVPYIGATGNVDLGTHQITLDATNYNTTPSITPVIGSTYWDATDETLATMLNSQVTLQHGQEMHVRAVNKTGVQINDGDVVYIDGAQGNRPTIALAQANTMTTSHTIGVATQNIADNAEGFVTVRGVVRGYNTSGFTEGDALYLSASSAGDLTNTVPVTPNYVVLVGYALNSTNNGQILVDVKHVLSADSALTLNSDELAVSQKAIKSYVTNRLALVVKYSDTASMLVPYLRSIDTTNKWVYGINAGWGIDVTGGAKFPVISVDSSEVATQYDLTQLGANYIQNQSATTQTGTFKISGIGTAQKYIATDTADDGGNTTSGFSVQRTLSSEIGANGHGYKDNTVFNRSGFSYNSYDALPTMTVTNSDHIVGFQSRFTLSPSGTVTHAYGYWSEPTFGGAGTVTNNYGVYLANPTGGGTVTNNYGMYIVAQSKGATLNRAIYTAGSTQSYFGGTIRTGGSLGVGKSDGASLSYALDVTGDIGFTTNLRGNSDGFYYSASNASLGIGLAGAAASTYSLHVDKPMRTNRSVLAGNSSGSFNCFVLNGSGGSFGTIQRTSSNRYSLGFDASSFDGTTLGQDVLTWSATDTCVGIGAGVANPDAFLELRAGQTNKAPLQFNSGTVRTTPQNGAVEFDGTHFYGTVGGTRYQLEQPTVLLPANGGTGIANTGTITVSGNTTIGSSTNTVAFATSGNTSVTLPTTGTLATLTGSETLTNKTLTTPIISSISNTGTLTLPTVTATITAYKESNDASSATPTPIGDARQNKYYLTALATAPTFAAPSGTPSNGNELLIRIKDNGTARALGWNAIYRGGTSIALPTTTVINKTMYVQFTYNSADSKWDLVGLTDGL